MTFQESIQEYALNWSAFCVAVKKRAKMIKAFSNEDQRVVYDSMTEDERVQFFRLGDAVNRHAFRCNEIAKRIGFTSLTAEHKAVADPEADLALVLSKEGV